MGHPKDAEENPTTDNRKTKEFGSWSSYQEFAHQVSQDRLTAKKFTARAFIETVIATASNRSMRLEQGRLLFRAQLGAEFIELDDKESGPTIITRGHPGERMKPLAGKATEGRANPAGVAYLYLASRLKTAISEVRPWIGSYVSVAQFEILRDMKILNLTEGHGGFGMGELTFDQLERKVAVDAETKRRAVWIDIDAAFSRPTHRSEDLKNYIPTQVLAEAFRTAGYEGVVYRSNFGEPGYNIALFDPDDADPINCTPYKIEKIDIEAVEAGNPWNNPKKSGKV
jgi:hypothetical protein